MAGNHQNWNPGKRSSLKTLSAAGEDLKPPPNLPPSLELPVAPTVLTSALRGSSPQSESSSSSRRRGGQFRIARAAGHGGRRVRSRGGSPAWRIRAQSGALALRPQPQGAGSGVHTRRRRGSAPTAPTRDDLGQHTREEGVRLGLNT